MINNIASQSKELIRIWFNNLKNGRQNSEILLLCFNDNKINFKIELDKHLDNFNDSLYINIFSKFNNEELQKNKKKNIILLNNVDINLFNLDNFKNENITILFTEINNIVELNNLINTPPNNLMNPNQLQQHFFYIKKLDFLFVLKNIYIIENIIDIFMNDNKNTTCKFNKSSIKRYLFRGKESIDLNRIKNDITYYKKSFQLTSRLAIFIYKICTFDLTANEKYIGLEFAKNFAKSKILNNKKFDITNTKGYSTINFIYNNELNIRLDIANKLRNLNICNNEEIFNITGIDLNLLNKIK